MPDQFDVFVRADWGRKVRERRAKLGWSQTTAAAKAGMHQGQWSKLEASLEPVSDETKWRACAALGAPIGVLFPWPESCPVIREEPMPAIVFADEAS